MTFLCRFLDSIGVLFSDKYERILEENKNYGIMELQERMTKWRDNRRGDALAGLVDLLGPDFLKKK